MSERPRFGEAFPEQFDKTNRMNPFRDKEQDPSYLAFSEKIRETLKQTGETEGWPEAPANIEKVEDLFDAARGAVSERWKTVEPIIEQEFGVWQEELATIRSKQEKGMDEEMESALAECEALLKDPKKFHDLLSVNQFDAFSALRKFIPDAWRALVLASSERQLAMVAVLNRWIKEIPEQKIEKTGMSKAELTLFTDLSSILGKYIDHAYIRQIELADLPGGSDSGKLKQSGSKYVYDLYVPDTPASIQKKTYAEVFPFEWKKLTDRLSAIAEKTRRDVENKTLPDSYTKLADYLDHMALVYGSPSTKPKELQEAWQSLLAHARELAQSDCPLILVPQDNPGVAGDAGKVDTEIRPGIRTPEIREWEKVFEIFRERAQELINEYPDAVEKPQTVRPVMLNKQPFAFGPNQHWKTRGENTEQSVFIHVDTSEEVAMDLEFPTLQRMVEISTDKSAYAKAAVIDTVLHEIAHSVLKPSDEKIRTHVGIIGKEKPIDALEELKAETLALKLLRLQEKKGGIPPEINLEDQFLAKIGTCINYIKNKKSGNPYHVTGVAVIGRLLEKGILKKSPDDTQYVYTDFQAGIDAIVEIGDELTQLYSNEKTTEKSVAVYKNKIDAQKQGELMQEFISLLNK